MNVFLSEFLSFNFFSWKLGLQNSHFDFFYKIKLNIFNYKSLWYILYTQILYRRYNFILWNINFIFKLNCLKIINDPRHINPATGRWLLFTCDTLWKFDIFLNTSIRIRS